LKKLPPRILILSTGHLSNNPRVLKEARALGNSGYSVTVVGQRFLPALDNSDRTILKYAPFEHINIDIIGSSTLSISTILGTFYRGKRFIAKKLLKYFNWQSIESLGPAATLLRLAQRIPADLTIVHNEVAQWVGLQLIKEGRQIAVDFEDWNSEDLLFSERVQRPLGLLRYTESALLHQAAYTTTTSNALADGLYKRYGGQRPTVITNSFPLPPRLSRDTPRKEQPSFFWFSQTIGPGRGLEPFLAAYALLKRPSQLTLLGQISPRYREYLLSLLPDTRRSRINFHPLVSPDELPFIIAQHDIGLALEPHQPLNKELTISNKILQYLGAGLVVIATPTLGQREVLSHSSAAGIFLNQLDDPLQTAATLDSLLGNLSELDQRQRAARRLAETRYSWECEEPRLLSLVDQTIGKSTGGYTYE